MEKKHKYKCETLIKCRDGHVACKADMIAPGLYIFPEVGQGEEVRRQETILKLDRAVRDFGWIMHTEYMDARMLGKPVDDAKIEKKFKAIFKAVGLKPPKM